jgi:hypothetical protein
VGSDGQKLNKNVVVLLSMLGFAAIIRLSVFRSRASTGRPKHYVELAKRYKEGRLKRAASLYHCPGRSETARATRGKPQGAEYLLRGGYG